MDPDKALAELRQMAMALELVEQAELEEPYLWREAAEEFIAKFQHLDHWLSNKGFLPSDWSHPGNNEN